MRATKDAIELLPGAPVVIALERSASMLQRDCAGMSRWDFALKHLRDAFEHLAAEDHPITLITFGRGTATYPRATVETLERLQNGDSACCTGQAAGEALYHVLDAPHAGSMIITDGLPDQDTPLGTVLLRDPEVMARLFARTWLLTVGHGQAPEAWAFYARWPNYAALETLVISPTSSVEVVVTPPAYPDALPAPVAAEPDPEAMAHGRVIPREAAEAAGPEATPPAHHPRRKSRR